MAARSRSSAGAGRRSSADRQVDAALTAWRCWAADATGVAGQPGDPWAAGFALAAVRSVAAALRERFGAPDALLGELDALAPALAIRAAVPVPAGLAAAAVDALIAGTADQATTPEPVRVAHLLASVHEAVLGRGERRGRGVFYTPPAVAARLAALALPTDPSAVGPPAPGAAVPDVDPAPAPVLDPACGAGTFLVAVAERLHRERAIPPAACVDALHGRDLDPVAVAVARTALAWWSWQRGGSLRWPGAGVRVGDGLALPAADGPPAGCFGAVVGNPPFLNQLQGRTARAATARASAHARFGDAAKGYVDTAVLFLLAAVEAVAPGGRVVLVQPESTVAATHAAAARAALACRAELEAIWFGGAGLFAAGVRVCAPVLRRVDGQAATTPQAPPVRLLTGPAVDPAGWAAPPPGAAEGHWAPLLAAARGVPPSTVRGASTLAALATATAGFRDQYYGLVPYVRDAPADIASRGDGAGPAGGRRFAPLITAGLIGPTGHRWGRSTVRFAGQVWSRPVIDLEALAAGNPKLHDWVARRLRPKLLVATQTKALHAATDPAGALVPSVPVIAVEPVRDDDLWLVAAVLWCPLVSVHAAEQFAGGGLSAGALRLSARQVLSLPVPDDREAWAHAAALLQNAHEGAIGSETNTDHLGERVFDDVARSMSAAYGCTAAASLAAMRWWRGVSDRHRAAMFL